MDHSEHHHDRHTGHDGHTGRDRHGAGRRTAAQATLHCLTGCAVGEVLGMVVGTAAGLHNGTTVAVSVVLAFVFGYALTMRGLLGARVPSGRPSRPRWPRTPCPSR